jgi:hypothetical protein
MDSWANKFIDWLDTSTFEWNIFPVSDDGYGPRIMVKGVTYWEAVRVTMRANDFHYTSKILED